MNSLRGRSISWNFYPPRLLRTAHFNVLFIARKLLVVKIYF